MPLKQLILNGFKSFASPTKINFATGITGIVGPNGSGKSNIAEAIRWVMGEGSAKALRSSSMQDVIFAGSENRDSLNHASVSLVFDNSKHELDNPAAEITVTRRLLSSGDNEYLINGKTVRLKDVRALFLSGGISAASLAIISQGRVDSVLNSRPDQRRQIFEEAAGILHFKEQKKQALRQLSQTNENLVRVHDLVQEVEGRVGPLAEQSSLARDYLFQKRQLADQEKTLLVMQVSSFDQKNKRLQDKLRQKKELTRRLTDEVKKAQEQLSACQEKSSQQQAEREKLSQLLLNLSKRQADLETREQLAQQQAGFNAAKRKEWQAQLSQLELSAQQTKKQLLQTKAEEAKLAEQVADLDQQIASLQEETADKRAELKSQLADKRSERLQRLEAQTKLRSKLTAWQTQDELAASQNKAAAAKLAAQLQSQGQELTILKQTVETLQEDLQKQRKQRQELQEKIKQGRTEQAALNRSLQEQNAKTERLRGQAHTLQGLQQRHDGYRYGVKTVLNDLPSFPGIIGVVGELLTFDSRYEAALTSALGGGAQDLVAEDAQAAKLAIEELKRRRGGRASFLPLDRLRFRPISAPTKAYLRRLPGFIGLGSELVHYEPGIEKAVAYLLGSVIVTDTLDTALIAAKRAHGSKVVTLGGDIIMPGGLMTGGSRSQQHSPLALSGQLASVQAALKESVTASSSLQAEAEQLTSQLAELVATDHDLAQKISEDGQGLAKKEADLDNSQRRYDRLQKDLASYTEQEPATLLADKIEDGQQRLEALQHLTATLQKEIASLESKLTAFDKQKEAVDSQLRKLLPQRAEFAEKLASRSRYGEELEQAQRHNAGQRAGLEKRLAGLSESDGDEDFAQEKASLNKQQESVKNSLQQVSTAMGTVAAQINQLQSDFATGYERQQLAVDDEKSCQRDADRCASQLQEALQKLSSEFSLSYEAAAEQVTIPQTDEEREELARQVKLHEKTIAELGTVNLQAIDEYKQVKQRYDFLSQQENDLLAARANLQKAMSDMDQRAGQQFKDSFDRVAASFAKLFPLVFGGGSAQLKLTEPDQLLTSGVAVMACPPGKKRQELSLLSGGERALTAITLLFAILETNPVPFCVLDEVEAALDDVNVERFGRFLHRFAEKTQFIVISHRQGTIVQADQLCGVVMQEAGVSQVMSVSLQEIKKEIN